MKRVALFLCILFAILAAGSLVGKSSFSNHSASEPVPTHPSLTPSSFKMSGVIKAVEVTDPNHSRLILVGENGHEKTVSLSTDTILVLEDEPLPISELRPGDAVDIDYVFDEKTQEPIVQKASVITRSSGQTVQEQDLSGDPEFE